MIQYYTLNEKKEPIPCTREEWTDMFDGANGENRVVKQEEINNCNVSTVFLGLDHRFDPTGAAPPILFETMVFGASDEDEYQTRCSTWDEALKMHAAGVKFAKKQGSLKNRITKKVKTFLDELKGL